MRMFHNTVLVMLGFLLLTSFARAEEPRFVPQVDVGAIKTTGDVYHAKQWANSRLYERKQEVNSNHYNRRQVVQSAYYNKRLDALKKVRSANYEAYLQWLDAREMMEFDRVSKIETDTPEFQVFLHELAEIHSARDKEMEALEAERDLVIAEIEAVHDVEIEIIDQTYEKVKASK